MEEGQFKARAPRLSLPLAALVKFKLYLRLISERELIYALLLLPLQIEQGTSSSSGSELERSSSPITPFLHAFPLEIFELIIQSGGTQLLARTSAASFACLQLFTPQLYGSVSISDGLSLSKLFCPTVSVALPLVSWSVSPSTDLWSCLLVQSRLPKNSIACPLYSPSRTSVPSPSRRPRSNSCRLLCAESGSVQVGRSFPWTISSSS